MTTAHASYRRLTAQASPTSLTRSGAAALPRLLVRSPEGAIGMALLALLGLAALLAPMAAPFDPIRIEPTQALYSPGLPYAFGTDQYGRDVLSRVLVGTRLALQIGPVAVTIALVPGVTIGLLAGYYGRWIDQVLMRLVDILLAFPGILFALAIIAVLGPSLPSVMVAVGLSSMLTYARLARASLLAAREHLYVEAARVVGAGDGAILVRHILPNVVAPLIVVATLGVGSAILVAATLSFLGLGSQPPTPEWGRMLAEGRSYLRDQWWIATFPGLAIMLTVLALNLLGDGLRDALDPRLKI
jgi:peptide/nickel transport system permease protein